MVERTALKLLPIMKELGTRLAGAKAPVIPDKNKEPDSELSQDDSSKKDNVHDESGVKVDMRNILGHFSQNEWIMNLNIGEVIQIQPVQMKDLLIYQRNEEQLSRDSFLQKLQLLIVSYFCVSTEFRFLNDHSIMSGDID